MKFKKNTIIDITTAAFLLVLIILSKQSFLNINFGVMRFGVSYAFIIATGLLTRLFLGLFVAVLGDTLALLLNGTIGLWHYSYFVIPIAIILITNALKFALKIQNPKQIIVLNGIFIIIMVATIYSLLIAKHDFVKQSRNDEIAIDLTNATTQILIWSMFGLMALYTLAITISYYRKPANKLRDYIAINIIVSTVIIILIWFYGPIAQILWLSDQFGKDYWSSYSIYQIPRIIKTPVSLLFYNFIVVAIFQINKLLRAKVPRKW